MSVHTFQKYVDGATTQVVVDGNTTNGNVTILNPSASEDVWLIGNAVYSSSSVSTAITTQGFRLKAGKALSMRMESTDRLWGRSVTGTQTISIAVFVSGGPLTNNHG